MAAKKPAAKKPAAKTAAKKPAAKPASKPAADFMLVQDTLATESARTHSLIDSKGKTHIFTFSNEKSMVRVPSDVVTASRLIQNETFTVRKTKDGLPLKARSQTTEQAVLQADECVAHYDELTGKALLTRCLNAGADFNTRTSRDSMVTFLMGATPDDMEEDEEEADFTDEEGNETEVSEEELEETGEELVARLQAQNAKLATLTESQLAAALAQQAS